MNNALHQVESGLLHINRELNALADEGGDHMRRYGPQDEPEPVPEPPDHELPEGWTALGCYTDTAAPRTLGAQVSVHAAMTIERCIATCDAADYKYAGLEFGSEWSLFFLILRCFDRVLIDFLSFRCKLESIYPPMVTVGTHANT